jgi:hypothetical protein
MDVEEMESSSKIDLKDVLWWMFIRNACRPRVLVTTRFSKKKSISLIVGGRTSHATHKHD